MKTTVLIFIGLAFLTYKNQAQTVTDFDGNIYNTVTIGTQVWLKENLKSVHFSNGDSIPFVAYNYWDNLTTPAYCNYFNDTANVSTYGRLYNWYTVADSRNMCPIAWHVPSDTEWTVLTDYLGGDSIAGGKMKEPDTIHWLSPNVGASNSSGFTGLPGGYLSFTNPMFYNKRFCGYFWSSTGCDTCGGYWSRELCHDAISIIRDKMPEPRGYSVRCLRDSAAKINEINEQDNINIYPNPATDKVYIVCSNHKVLILQIYNVLGECVVHKELSSANNEIDIGSLPKGIYIIRLVGNDWTGQKKIIKE